MSTLWTLTKLVRWRVRDWASCFLPLDDEQDVYRPQLPIRNMVFEMKEDGRGNRNGKKLFRRRHRRKEDRVDRRLNLSPRRSRNAVSAENGVDGSSWPGFADEEYIVFCFREDGAFDVVRDGRSEEYSSPNTSSETVNRKVDYVGGEKRVKESSSHEGRPEDDENDNFSRKEAEIIPVKMGEEGGSKGLDSELDSGGTLRRRYHQVEETRHKEMVSAGSSDSNHSDGSTGSFAFPVLGWEWMGSPVQMPRTEEMNSRNNKPRSLRFQCCRF
ncbi:hypothetical protein SLE2022_299250 [Rubroshorea leprosula]